MYFNTNISQAHVRLCAAKCFSFRQLRAVDLSISISAISAVLGIPRLESLDLMARIESESHTVLCSVVPCAFLARSWCMSPPTRVALINGPLRKDGFSPFPQT